MLKDAPGFLNSAKIVSNNGRIASSPLSAPFGVKIDPPYSPTSRSTLPVLIHVMIALTTTSSRP